MPGIDPHSNDDVSSSCQGLWSDTDGPWSDADGPWSPLETVDVDALLQLPDATFEALAAEPRRCILAHLLDGDGAATTAELALVAAAVRHGIEIEEVTADQQWQLALELRHAHLPKLADHGFIEWDRDAGIAWLTNE